MRGCPGASYSFVKMIQSNQTELYFYEIQSVISLWKSECLNMPMSSENDREIPCKGHIGDFGPLMFNCALYVTVTCKLP